MAEPVRIANGGGFWGDSVDAPARLVRGGPLDYLTMDYLAEVTMSIMQAQKSKRPEAGYARDFTDVMREILPELREKGIRVVTNAGGVNPEACVDALVSTARELGVTGLKIAVVKGDDILDRMDELTAEGLELNNMETGEPISNILDRIVSANVYLGAFPMAEALDAGADIVITGRVTDTGLVLAPMIHEFGWKREDWDLLAAGTVAGHILECGAQATGGNYSRWWEVPDYTNIGYPIAEAFADGSFIITKHEGTGGVVNRMSVSEQLLYEMGDPHGYITPDCVADFTSIELLEEGKDRVRISGVRGSEATDTYKVSINYRSCFKASGSLTISGPYASSKAEKCAEIVWSRLKEAGYEFEDTNTEYLGVCTDHEQVTPMHAQAREVVLRLGVRDKGRAKVERFRKELAPLITNGPPGVTGFADGRPRVREIIAYFPVLIPKRYIKTSVEAVEI